MSHILISLLTFFGKKEGGLDNNPNSQTIIKGMEWKSHISKSHDKYHVEIAMRKQFSIDKVLKEVKSLAILSQ